METVFEGKSGYKNLDYISSWFLKGSKYIQDGNIELAFISLNQFVKENKSQCYGLACNLNIEIGFPMIALNGLIMQNIMQV